LRVIDCIHSTEYRRHAGKSGGTDRGAAWFWTADKLDDAPLPRDFTRLVETTKSTVRDLWNQYRFFHWELDFPDVFARERGGFDAMVGNPPWEIQKRSNSFRTLTDAEHPFRH
jgi:hypothetical protein